MHELGSNFFFFFRERNISPTHNEGLYDWLRRGSTYENHCACGDTVVLVRAHWNYINHLETNLILMAKRNFRTNVAISGPFVWIILTLFKSQF